MQISIPQFLRPLAYQAPVTPDTTAPVEVVAADAVTTTEEPDTVTEKGKGKSAQPPAHEAKALLGTFTSSEGVKINLGLIVSAIARGLDPLTFLRPLEAPADSETGAAGDEPSSNSLAVDGDTGGIVEDKTPQP